MRQIASLTISVNYTEPGPRFSAGYHLDSKSEMPLQEGPDRRRRDPTKDAGVGFESMW